MDSGGITGAFGRFGLSGLPMMLVVTLLSLFGWLITYFVHLLLLALVRTVALAAGAGVGVQARWRSSPPPCCGPCGAAVGLRPPPDTSLLGRVAVVRTPEVSARLSGRWRRRPDPAGASDDAGMVRGDLVVPVEHIADGNTGASSPNTIYRNCPDIPLIRLRCPDGTRSAAAPGLIIVFAAIVVLLGIAGLFKALERPTRAPR